MELKPLKLRELERRTQKLNVALESQSERVELLRLRVSGSEVLTGVFEQAVIGDDPSGRVMSALLRVRKAREARARDLLLDRASRFVCRVTGGRILAISSGEEGVCLEGDHETLRIVSEEDLSAAKIALRLAAASLVSSGGQGLGSLLFNCIMEIWDEASGSGPELRPTPAGLGRFSLKASAPQER